MSSAPPRVAIRFDVPWTHASWVLEDTTVPESGPQDNATRTMDSTWQGWRGRTGRVVCIHRNLAVRWNPRNPRIGVDPDLCLLEPPPATPGEALTSLRTWEPGNAAPRVAFEVVSESNADKDYRDGPRKHAAAGVGELWVFDPQRLGPEDDDGPWVLQVWGRDEEGVFQLVVASGGMLLRMSDDPEGTKLWPTEGEDAGQQRAEKERERAQKESALALAAREREEKERERAEKERALARVAEVEALLAAVGDARRPAPR
jgi:Uma2 family endonuclease